MRWCGWVLTVIAVGAACLMVRIEPSVGEEIPLPRGSASAYRSILAGQEHRYGLHLEPGQYASVTVDQRDIDVRVAASGPGFESTEINGSEWGQEGVAIVARTSGTYCVRVIAGKGDSRHGRYRITLAALRPMRGEDEAGLRAYAAFAKAARTLNTDPESRRLKEDLLRRAIDDWLAAGDLLHAAQALNLCGRLYQTTGRYTEAQGSFERALRLWSRIGEPAGRLETLKLIANLGNYFGEQRAPRSVLLEWLKAWRQLGDRRGEAMMLGSLGRLSHDTREFEQAVSYEQQALRLRERLGNRREIAGSLGTISGYYNSLGRYPEALAYAEHAVRLARASLSPHDLAAALSGMGYFLLSAGNDLEAVPYLQESLRIRQTEGDLQSQASIHHYLSVIERRRGNTAAALSHIRRTLEIEDRLSGAITQPVWKWAFSGWTVERIEYIDQLVELQEKEPAARYGLQAFLEVDQARGRFIARAKRAGVPELAKMLDGDCLLLEYWTSETRGVVWVLTGTGLRLVPLADVNEIHKLSREALNLVSTPGSTDQETRYGVVIQELSRLLLGPVAFLLPRRRLLIVSDESFAFLPFASLPDPNRSDAAPLIADHEIVHLVSASAEFAAEKRRRPMRKDLMAVVADPVFDSGDPRVRAAGSVSPTPVEPELSSAVRSVGVTTGNAPIPRLPYGRQEARAISALRPSDITTFLDFAASRETVIRRLDQYRILHFGTHGLVNGSAPELSGLVLSLVDREGRPREGFLRLRDIYDLTTSADLVTLGACQTAVGHATRAHGVIGLTGAFLHAGASRVLSTAWKVDDEATTVLMTAFYEGLFREHLSPAGALRRAQRMVAAHDRWRSPYYWAGVLLYGDWRPLWSLN